MKRQWIMSVAALLVTGCDGVLGIESAESLPPAPIPECTTDAQCSSRDSACTRFVCEEGACVQQFVDFGIPIQEQKAGDCTVQVCDGFGGTTPQVDPFDVQDDQNPCTLDQCVGSTLQHLPQADVNIPCYEGPPGTEGIGICHSGVIECDSIGNLIGCKGQVLPQAEVCQTAIDENCNGLSTLTEGCQCGDGIVSGNEQCDDGTTSNADDCSATCSVQRVEQIVGGSLHFCALLSGGRMKCWGRDAFGEIGQNTEDWLGWDRPWQMGANLPEVHTSSISRPIRQIQVGAHANTCVVFEDGGTKCWGLNTRGVLGQPSLFDGVTYESWAASPETLPDIPVGGEVVAITGYYAHKCALLKDGQVKCWGLNHLGQLGLTNFGDGVQPALVELGGESAIAVAAGAEHSCALLKSGNVKCWGGNGSGQLGRDNTDSYGGVSNQMISDLKPINLGLPAIAIAAGYVHSCALLVNRQMKCWGNNEFGQLGLGHKNNIGDTVAPSPQQSEMTTLQPVYLGLAAGVYIEKIYAFGHKTCAIFSNKTAKCWGVNPFDCPSAPQLPTNNIGDNSNETGAYLLPLDVGEDAQIEELAANDIGICAILSTGNVKCWGCGIRFMGADPMNGQYYGDSPGEMGAMLPTTRLFSDVW